MEGISNDGLVMTGFGFKGTFTEAWVVDLRSTTPPPGPVDVPEPGSMALAALGAAALVRARRRRAVGE